MAIFRDFIPEGEDTGALGNGFKDFVPPKKPVFAPAKKTAEEKQVEEPDKKGAK